MAIHRGDAMKRFPSNLIAAAIATMLATPAWADTPASPAAAGSKPSVGMQLLWDARLRDETVDDAAFVRDAHADTLRLRLGLLGDFGGGWSGLIEGAGVAGAGNRYNSGANGQTRYPAITDPRGSELNQAWLRWHNPHFTATAGRQELTLDNQRWVGNVGWRQFEQTYDAVALQWKPAGDWVVRYDWLDRVHRVAGPDAISPLARARKLATSLFNVTYARGAQTWVGYSYLHEDRDVPAASTATWGLRWQGTWIDHGNGPGWTAELARQSDHADNPASYTTTYWLLEPSWSVQGVTARLGWEHLGGDGVHALQAPLATLHAFNGWDDQFTVTPAGGLEDRYVAMKGKFDNRGPVGKLGWAVSYHDYRADPGGRYGREWDGSLAIPLATGFSALLKVANYHADGYGHDDAKLWLQMEWQGRQTMSRAN
jgi:hypothetical protein